MATPPTPLPRISPEMPGVPPPPKKQNILIWILSGCGTVLVLLVIVGALAFHSFMKNNFHVGPNGEVDLKMGAMSMHTGKAPDVGLPIYPGVDIPHAMGMEATLPTQKFGTQSVSQAIYSSTDSAEKVDAWYHQNLGPEFIRLDAGKGQAVLGDNAFPLPNDLGAISYSTKRGETRYAVTIHSILGNTQIKLMRANPVVPSSQ
nr:hypothetical protein [Candidatus Acidoferrales bacterium]